MPRLGLLLVSLASAVVAPVIARAAVLRHPITLNDVFRVKDVNNPEVSPNGNWVLYTVSSMDLKKDRVTTDLWMVSWDGRHDLQLTFGYNGSVSSPGWSPAGKYISFLSDRKGRIGGTQVWVLRRRGAAADRREQEAREDRSLSVVSGRQAR